MKKILLPAIRIFRRLRNRFWSQIFRTQCRKCGPHIGVSTFCRISADADVEVDDFFHSNGLKVLGGGELRVGKQFQSGHGCTIMLGSHDFDNGECIPYGKRNTRKQVIIGDFVWMGTNSSIVGNITVGNGAIIGYGAVVVKDVPDYAIVGGNPAKIIKYRHIEHYNSLLAQEKFN